MQVGIDIRRSYGVQSAVQRKENFSFESGCSELCPIQIQMSAWKQIPHLLWAPVPLLTTLIGNDTLEIPQDQGCLVFLEDKCLSGQKKLEVTLYTLPFFLLIYWLWHFLSHQLVNCLKSIAIFQLSIDSSVQSVSSL